MASPFQRKLFNFQNPQSPVANWYNHLDEESKTQIQVRFSNKRGTAQPDLF
jgi:hypothetical protein